MLIPLCNLTDSKALTWFPAGPVRALARQGKHTAGNNPAKQVFPQPEALEALAPASGLAGLGRQGKARHREAIEPWSKGWGSCFVVFTF